jgi:hypothetical protein
MKVSGTPVLVVSTQFECFEYKQVSTIVESHFVESHVAGHFVSAEPQAVKNATTAIKINFFIFYL